MARFPGEEADRGLQDAGGQGRVFDPADVVRVDLRGQQRQQRGPSQSDRAHGRDDGAGPPAQRDQQPGALERDGEDGEVVAVEGERGGQGPERQVGGRAGAQRPREEPEGEGAEEDERRVGAGLLRVPDQHRVDRDEGRGQQARPAAGELPGREEGDGDRRNAEQGGKRAQADFGGPERLRPDPGEHVVERGVRLAGPDLVEHVAEAAGEHARGGDHLVVVIALHAEACEAGDDAGRGDPDQRAGHREPGSHARPRSAERPRVDGRIRVWEGGRAHGLWREFVASL